MTVELNDYIPLAKVVAREFAKRRRPYVDVDDAISEALIGLCRARDTYDPASPASFGTWAKLKVKYHLYDWAREMSWAPRLAIAQAKQGGTAVREMVQLGLNFKGEPHDIATALVDVGDEFDGMLKLFNWQDAHMLRRYYADGWPMHAIGDELGVSESRISQRHTMAIDRLRCILRSRAG